MAEETAWSYVLDEPVRLLAADDDPILREFAKVHLATPQATVEAAADGDEAWRKLQEEEFDLVLLDIDMPGRDGFELLRLIRSDPRLSGLPCVMLTGREDIASIDRAYALGSSSFATKPVNWRQLSYHLLHVLRSARAEQELRARPQAPAARAQEADGERVRFSLETIEQAAMLLAEEARDEATASRLQTIVTEARRALRTLLPPETPEG
ncbi:response regulator [Lutibaculum baratangense]|uniref:Response regulator n=1 Tax=Lutibaculum baratangense AMV1 TaxID=631454 RepID=V4RJZ7_9HYPH|nr:response regulator [Lutibaculum baratangense]ESR25659.1 response regulator [Lutibaculum baratangense AMV1]